MKDNFEHIRSLLGSEAKLIAVSKTKSVAEIKALYDLGQRDFGENKVQELLEKKDHLPDDIRWHLIGHLQSNKVKYIADFISAIHSVDSFKLLREINKQGANNNRVIDCLLQIHIAEEESKFGLSLEELKAILDDPEFVEMNHINILGIMGMATNTSDENQVRIEFRELKGYFEVIRSHYFKFNPDFKEISMGMSSDFQIALEEGSTMVRIGSALFGSRK